MNKILKYPILVFSIIILMLSSFNEVNTRKYKLKKIVIDAGHGGKDQGCHGKTSKEKTIALDVALKLGKLVKTNLEDVKVIFTRDKDEFIELHDRASVANKNNADLFISIHCNSAHADIHGSETYTMGLHTTQGNLEVAKRENDVILKEDNYKQKYDGFDPQSPIGHILFSNYQSAHMTNSLQFAAKVEDEFVKNSGRRSRGVKQAGFLVLWKTTMPAALIEIGYLTNKKDEKYLSNSLKQEEIAKSIYEALKSYKYELEAQ